MMRKERRNIFSVKLLALMGVAIVAIVALCGGNAMGASPESRINASADVAKARNMVNSLSAMGSNAFFARRLFDEAKRLAPGDTLVMLETNDFALRLEPQENPVYYEQLDLLEKVSNPSMLYYYVLTRSTPLAQGDEPDSMAFHNTALRAYKRFPKEGVFIDNLLSRGVNYVSSHRYKHNDKGTLDTLDLSEDVVAFANKILALADTVEQQNGFTAEVDRTRAGLYHLLGRDEDFKTLARQLEQRDSTDIEGLDLLTSMAYIANDTLKLSELGIRRFQLEPDPQHVYSLYSAMPDTTLRNEFADIVLETSLNTDLDPSLRINLLSGLAKGYYEEVKLDSIPDKVPLLANINDALTEITAEDTSDDEIFIRSVLISTNTHWVGNYGYKHLVDAVKAIPDSADVFTAIATMIVPYVKTDPDFENMLRDLENFHEKKEDTAVLDSKMLLAQYYFNNKMYEKCLAILKNISLDDFREAYARQLEAEGSDGDRSAGELSDDKEYLSRWIMSQELMAECQMNLGDTDAALATLNHVIAIDPENAGALNNLAYYMCENGKDLAIALSLVERSLKIESSNLNAIDTRAWIQYRRGNYDAALKDMKLFFELCEVPFEDVLLNTESTQSIEDAMESMNINQVIVSLAHLLAIAEAKGYDEHVLWRLADVVERHAPDNAELLDFKSKHKRPSEEITE